MEVFEVGEGTPEIAVVGGIHGDEPCGVRAVERLLADDEEFERSVKLIIANEEALEVGERYVERDLNRAFPGDPDGDTHEGRLAHRLQQELTGCTTLAIHSTQSYAEPFAVIDSMPAARRMVGEPSGTRPGYRPPDRVLRAVRTAG